MRWRKNNRIYCIDWIVMWSKTFWSLNHGLGSAINTLTTQRKKAAGIYRTITDTESISMCPQSSRDYYLYFTFWLSLQVLFFSCTSKIWKQRRHQLGESHYNRISRCWHCWSVPTKKRKEEKHTQTHTTSGVPQPKNIHFGFNNFQNNYYFMHCSRCEIITDRKTLWTVLLLPLFKQFCKVMISFHHHHSSLRFDFKLFYLHIYHCRTQNIRWMRWADKRERTKEMKRDLWRINQKYEMKSAMHTQWERICFFFSRLFEWWQYFG